MAELRFVLKLGDQLIRGRMDAVYENPGGGLEIVDFKSGEHAAKPDLDQLIIYAGALRKLEIALGETLKLTYAYLAGGVCSSREVRPEEIDEALAGLAKSIAGGAYHRPSVG